VEPSKGRVVTSPNPQSTSASRLAHKAAVMGKAIAEEKKEEGKTAELSPLFSFLGRFYFLEGVAESTGFLAEAHSSLPLSAWQSLR
jgi:hypothetical protein